ncbi:RIP metalloprotease RseP [Candidatus Trichorickettsia mobilis]|uniref:RIP metalloprotease RseP n=1 Tax=Candidatus Trichorickettsia mobilis TaxID=1346319 RepID=UPI00292D12E1|nr:RIP metalloprotease RseP [Candidatus Trichorickettsia mobilis]
MLTITGFILAMGLLVFVHEFGHYYIAKTFGVKIEEFSIGFGKELFVKIDTNGVRWKICAIPLGGFVKMYGDRDITSTAKVTSAAPDFSFYHKPWYIKFLIVVAGPMANYLLAILILSCFYLYFGKPQIPAIIDTVIQDSPAATGGLLAGDKIVEADGNSISDFSKLQKIIMINANQQIPLLIERDDQQLTLMVTPKTNSTDANSRIKIGYIGITSKQDPTYIKMNVLVSSYQAMQDVVDISLLTLKALGQIIVGKRSIDEISGPLTIAQESGKSLSAGILDFILFVAMLSINLGLINLLPIPILDGGHLVIILCEAITRQPTSQLIQNILLKTGMIIITFLIVISVSNDIKSLIF